jgi:4a-hydroxytetrahydrobiopterin dehydratase
MKWSKKNNKLELTIQFKSQTELAEAFLKIAELADKSNHHPDAEVINCSTLILKLFTHDENDITEKDMELALAIEKIIYQ